MAMAIVIAPGGFLAHTGSLIPKTPGLQDNKNHLQMQWLLGQEWPKLGHLDKLYSETILQTAGALMGAGSTSGFRCHIFSIFNLHEDRTLNVCLMFANQQINAIMFFASTPPLTENQKASRKQTNSFLDSLLDPLIPFPHPLYIPSIVWISQWFWALKPAGWSFWELPQVETRPRFGDSSKSGRRHEEPKGPAWTKLLAS